MFRPVRRPRSPQHQTTAKSKASSGSEETKEEGGDQNEPEDGEDGEDEEAAQRRKRAKKEKAELDDLANLTIDPSAAPVDSWAVDPPTFPEMSELEFTNDHIALDRPWVLADAEDVEVRNYLLTPQSLKT